MLVFWFLEAIGQTMFATIMSVKVAGQKNSHTNSSEGHANKDDWFCHSHPLYIIVFQDSQLNLLSLMLIFLGCGVRLAFLSTIMNSHHKMKSGLLWNVVIRQSTSILQLLASKDQSGGSPSLFWILAFTFSVVSFKSDGFPTNSFSWKSSS